MSRNSSQKQRYPQTLEGVFRVGKNDIDYVRNKELDLVIDIPSHKSNTALNRDRVVVHVTNQKKGVGEVTEILKRNKVGFTGTLQKHGEHYTLVTSDNHDPEITIPARHITDEMSDKKVFVTIERWSDTVPIGRVEKIVGDTGNNDTEMNAIALEQGFDDAFPQEVEEEARRIEQRGITQQDMENRRDMRNVPTFTIDPEDAKDFDDALSFTTNDDATYNIGIHIADVSHYVQPDSALDKEAQERTTSVYLVDRTIPMLPEALSNNLCSLRPNEDRLAFSAIFKVNHQGDVLDEWFGRTVINSDKRFTYVEAQEVIDSEKGIFHDELTTLNNLAKHYTRKRLEGGALALDSSEVKFILDDDGTPIKVEKKHRIDTNKLIEEFMLLANKRVAAFMAKKTQRSVFVYRIHDKPDPDKMRDLWEYLKTLGYDITYKDGVIPPHELNALIREVQDSDIKEAIQTSIVRSMAKAIYTTENIGHYGLGFDFYTHFTSPIRRYPDVLVHRLLHTYLSGQEITRDDFDFYERMARHSSDREKDAQQAEWESIKYKQVEYMSAHIGETYQGTVTGLSKYGMFVREKETLAEGMIRLQDIPGDSYHFDEEKMRISGTKKDTSFTIGDTVTIQVLKTNLERRMIDYLLIL